MIKYRTALLMRCQRIRIFCFREISDLFKHMVHQQTWPQFKTNNFIQRERGRVKMIMMTMSAISWTTFENESSIAKNKSGKKGSETEFARCTQKARHAREAERTWGSRWWTSNYKYIGISLYCSSQTNSYTYVSCRAQARSPHYLKIVSTQE